MTEYLLGKISDLPERKGIAVQAGRRTIAVFRIGDDVFAVNNQCPHKGASLCEGEVMVEEKAVRCPWHHWNWQLENGALEADERHRIRSYAVRCEGDDVILTV